MDPKNRFTNIQLEEDEFVEHIHMGIMFILCN